MKQIYNVLVYENYTAKLESLLNGFRVGLNDWDRTKVFEIQNQRVVNYTIACDDETYKSIVDALNKV
jgi:hypothetical protein